MSDDAPPLERGHKPRVFVPVPSEALLRLDDLMRAGVEPVVMGLPVDLPAGGVALRREWVADWAEVFCTNHEVDAMILDAEEPEALFGLLVAALRLDLPAVALPAIDPFSLAFTALGLAPLGVEAFEAVAGVAETGRPLPNELISTFSLANALRAGLSAGAGPELLVHLAALAREAGASGFSRMMRVIAPESPAVASPDWLREHGPAGLLAGLGGALHNTPTVTGHHLKEDLPSAPPLPDAGGAERLFFVRGRASGTEVVCRARASTRELAGDCRVFLSEEGAVLAVEEGEIGEGHLIVVMGCGARGGPGLLHLNELGAGLVEAGLDAPVLTDGLPPSGGAGPSPWISLFSPEAASDGVIGLLEDGDTLRFDLAGGRIRTGIPADDLASRDPFAAPVGPRFGYAARYAEVALPALEGAGFE